MDCSYSIESFTDDLPDLGELESKATKLITQLGYSDFFLTKSDYRMVFTADELSKYYDGGFFRFVRSMPELSNSGCEWDYVEAVDYTANTHKYNQQEYIEIQLNANGDIVKMNVCVPYNMKEAMVDNVELLSFDTAMESAKYYFGQIPDEDKRWTMWESQTVSSIKLSYLPLEYDEQYAYMPVWILYTPNPAQEIVQERERAMFAVNAIDGNIYFLPDSLTEDE